MRCLSKADPKVENYGPDSVVDGYPTASVA
jgi:hypothetical protein